MAFLSSLPSLPYFRKSTCPYTGQQRRKSCPNATESDHWDPSWAATTWSPISLDLFYRFLTMNWNSKACQVGAPKPRLMRFVMDRNRCSPSDFHAIRHHSKHARTACSSHPTTWDNAKLVGVLAPVKHTAGGLGLRLHWCFPRRCCSGYGESS